jgi:hypothetical protein
MVDKRELSNEERELIEGSLKRMETEKDWLEFQRKHKELMLNEGLKLNYDRQVHKTKQELKDITDGLSQIEATSKVANKQLTEGVDVKESE